MWAKLATRETSPYGNDMVNYGAKSAKQPTMAWDVPITGTTLYSLTVETENILQKVLFLW